MSFREKYNLKRHEDRIHEKKILKMFECDKCSFKIERKARLNDHIALKHDKINKFLECDECYKTFPLEPILRRHKRLVHIIPTHECTVCKLKFKTKAKLDRHNAGVLHKNRVFKNVMQNSQASALNFQ